MTKPTFLAPLLSRDAGACVLVEASRGTLLASRVEPAFDSKTRKKGLLGRTTVPDDYVLIIAPSNAVHTWFMRFPIDIVFVSREGLVTGVREAVRPWRLAAAWRGFATIELAAGSAAAAKTAKGDRLVLVPGSA